MKIIYLLLISVFISGFIYTSKPGKIHGNYMLFKIDRSRDPDVVMYDVNLDDQDALNTEMPIRTYWKKNTQDGQFEFLTGIQKKLGYGLKFHDVTKNKADFQFVSNIDRTFELRRSNDDHYRVFTISQGITVEVKSLYIYFKDDSFWFPGISKIELHGIDTATRNVVIDIIIP